MSSTCGGEIDVLYGSGVPPRWNDAFGKLPCVTLNSPANNSNLTSSSVDFITTVTDDELVVNVSLILNGTIIQTNTSGFNGTYTFTETVQEGVGNWSILAYDNASLSNQSETRFFNFTQPPINITLNNPYDSFVSNIPFVNMSCSASDALGILQLNLTINGSLEETLTNTTIAENLTIHKNVTFAEGIYPWGCQAYNDMDTASSSNRTLNVSYSLPVVTLILPVNTSNITTPSTLFTFNATDVNGIGNVSLYINGVFDQINTSGVGGEYQFTQTFTEGLYNWSVVVVSTLGKQTTSETRVFNVTFSPPEITLNSPADNSNTTNGTVLFNFTAIDDNGIGSVSLYLNGLLNETNASGFNGTYIITKTLNEGFYNWSVSVISTLGKVTNSSNNSLIVHLTAPNATIFAPVGNLGYFLLGENETLSYSFTEPGQNLSEHLEECWYGYGEIENLTFTDGDYIKGTGV